MEIIKKETIKNKSIRYALSNGEQYFSLWIEEGLHKGANFSNDIAEAFHYGDEELAQVRADKLNNEINTYAEVFKNKPFFIVKVLIAETEIL